MFASGMTHGMRRLLRQFLLLGVLIAALFVLAADNRPTKASTCNSCYNESTQAYIYCRDHPGDYYQGCYVYAECGSGTGSATQIYQNNCCGVDADTNGDPTHSTPWYWHYYCL